MVQEHQWTEAAVANVLDEIMRKETVDPAVQLRAHPDLEQRVQGNFSMAGIRFWPEMQSLPTGLVERMAQFRQVVPVFTAHPTEVARRVVLFKRRRIARQLEELDRLPITDEEAARRQRLILADITALWQTDEVRRRQPTVADEIRMGLDHYRSEEHTSDPVTSRSRMPSSA